jgi:hypothetical protein
MLQQGYAKLHVRAEQRDQLVKDKTADRRNLAYVLGTNIVCA